MEDAFFRPGSASSYDELNTTLKRSKEKIVELIKEGVAAFDMDLVTCVSPDYSKEVIGCILQQKTCKCPDINPTCSETK